MVCCGVKKKEKVEKRRKGQVCLFFAETLKSCVFSRSIKFHDCLSVCLSVSLSVCMYPLSGHRLILPSPRLASPPSRAAQPDSDLLVIGLCGLEAGQADAAAARGGVCVAASQTGQGNHARHLGAVGGDGGAAVEAEELGARLDADGHLVAVDLGAKASAPMISMSDGRLAHHQVD